MTNRITIVVGHRMTYPADVGILSAEEPNNGELTPVRIARSGFWKQESVIALAHRLGLVGKVRVIYARKGYIDGDLFGRHEEIIQL